MSKSLEDLNGEVRRARAVEVGGVLKGSKKLLFAKRYRNVSRLLTARQAVLLYT
jgi:hypothetical protein